MTYKVDPFHAACHSFLISAFSIMPQIGEVRREGLRCRRLLGIIVSSLESVGVRCPWRIETSGLVYSVACVRMCIYLDL